MRIFALLKKFVSILLLFAMAFIQTPLLEILKVSVLIEHYNKHKGKDKKTTILSFLSMHYSHGDVQDSDRDDDMQLPFKQYSPVSMVFTFSANRIEQVSDRLCVVSDSRHTDLYHSSFYSGIHLNNIWQPPRQC